jgi:hypothetical protein
VLEVADVSAGEVVKWDAQPPKSVTPEYDVIHVNLLLPGSTAAGGDTLQLDRQSSPEPPVKSGILKWTIGLFALLAVAAGFFGWSIIRRRVRRSRRAPTEPSAVSAGVQSAGSAAPPVTPDWVERLEGRMAALESHASQEQAKDWGPVLDAMQQMERGVTAAAERALDEMVKTFVSTQELRQTAVFELERRVQELEERTRGAANGQGERLQRLIAELPAEVLENRSAPGATPEERVLIARGIGEAVSRYFQNGVPDTRLNELADQAGKLLQAIEAAAADREIPEPSASRLAVARRALKEMLDEIKAFAADNQARRAHLRFSVDYSLLAASNQTLADALAEALKREIVKWERPAEYFERQLSWAAVSAVTTLSDAADAYWDPERRDAALQALLANLFEAARLEQICPLRNAPWVSIEQDATGTVPRTRPDERSEAVARVTLRGLKRRQQVVRKAQVVLFS